MAGNMQWTYTVRRPDTTGMTSSHPSSVAPSATSSAASSTASPSSSLSPLSPLSPPEPEATPDAAPAAAPVVLSQHATSSGTVTWSRCGCGRARMVLIPDSPADPVLLAGGRTPGCPDCL